VAALARQAAADGLSHLALTDSHALYGAVRFVRACTAVGVQAIVGMSVALAPPPDFPHPDHYGPGLITLLATGPAGYRSLSHLSSELQGRSDRKARLQRGVALDDLGGRRAGVFAIFGGRRSWLQRWMQLGDERRAGRWLARLAGLFDERSALALEWRKAEDDPLLDALTALGGRFGVPAVAVHPVYSMTADERPRLRLLAAIDRNCRLEDVPATALPDEGDEDVDLHWLGPEALARRYARWPEALGFSDIIAGQCGPALPDGRPIWPRPPALLASDREAKTANRPGISKIAFSHVILREDSERRISSQREFLRPRWSLRMTQHNNVIANDELPDAPPAALLERAAREGMKERYGSDANAAIPQRLEKELAAIARHGYAPLFLVVADIVRYARAQQIPVSTRGSVANSLVAYVIGITTVDPIAHDLLFERFLSPARADAPDIDLDFGSRRRDEILAYVRDRYGADRVALVCTVSLMRPRSAVRETAKALGMDAGALGRLMRHIPHSRHPGARRKAKSLAEIAQEMPPEAQEALRLAAGVVGQPHHLSVHPGGTVITPGPLPDYAPVQWAPKGFLILQYDHQDAERIGLTKIDLLGVRALSVLDAAVRLVQKHYRPAFRLEAIPPEDAVTGEMLSKGETVGVFQCESSGAQRTLRKLRARTVADLAIANALFKPGPATGGMAAAFVRRYRGEERVRYLHPALEPILARTQGVLIYQEQILRVATEIAGLSWADADHLRRGMSKFKPQEMAALQQAFITGCQRPQPAGPGLSQRQAETLWEQVRAFAGYGFNQGHATAYADVSYRSAYIKAHWPAAYMAARLGERGGFHHPTIYMAEARRLSIPLRPPHINHSGRRFTLDMAGAQENQCPEDAKKQRNEEKNGKREEEAAAGPILWMGLDAVRDLRGTTIAAIVANRPFVSLADLLARVRLQARELTHLIQCGALDGLAESRNALLAQAPGARRGALQLAFDFLAAEAEPETPAQRLAWERRILGLPMSVHPLTLARPKLPADVVLLAQAQRHRGQRLRTAGVRLPGWTGGEGFYLGDEKDYVIAIPGDDAAPLPPLWQPIVVSGAWREDDWGRAWLEAEEWEEVIGD